MTRIKICGITNAEDALTAVAAGADALGFIFCESPRRIDASAAREIIAQLPPFTTTVGVFMNDVPARVDALAATARVDMVQLHGRETPEMCEQAKRRVVKRFTVEDTDDTAALEARMAPYRVAARLLDPGAGSGRAFDWSLARGLAGPLIVAGGLNPENVAEAVKRCRPYGVDVSSGVESEPGHKCAERLRAFVAAVRNCDVDSRT